MPNRNNFKTHEAYLEYYREYRENNREKFRKYNRKYNKEWRKVFGYHNEENWIKKNPEARKANQLLQYAVRTGMIKKAPCIVCGKIKPVQGHHKDYTKPLEVMWLCPLHHKQLHMNK